MAMRRCRCPKVSSVGSKRLISTPSFIARRTMLRVFLLKAMSSSSSVLSIGTMTVRLFECTPGRRARSGAVQRSGRRDLVFDAFAVAHRRLHEHVGTRRVSQRAGTLGEHPCVLRMPRLPAVDDHRRCHEIPFGMKPLRIVFERDGERVSCALVLERRVPLLGRFWSITRAPAVATVAEFEEHMMRCAGSCAPRARACSWRRSSRRSSAQQRPRPNSLPSTPLERARPRAS